MQLVFIRNGEPLFSIADTTNQRPIKDERVEFQMIDDDDPLRRKKRDVCCRVLEVTHSYIEDVVYIAVSTPFYINRR